MSKYKIRLHERVIKKKLQVNGGVIVEGPRFVGKSTTCLQLSNSSVRLDKNPKLLQTAEVAPETLLIGETPRLIDEWQLAPQLWNLVRHEIDDRHKKGQFILTGSATPDDEVTRHSGAGRIGRVRLRPMTLFECERSIEQINFADLFDSELQKVDSSLGGLTVPQYCDEIVRGGWPELFHQSVANASYALDDYVDNITRVDLKVVEERFNPVKVSNLMKALARNVATETTLETLAKEAEIGSFETVNKYINQLQRIFILEPLPVWSNHIRSSIKMRVKPKWHFADPSIAASLMGISPNVLLEDLEAGGFFFESLALRDIRVYADLLGGKVSFYKDSSNLEIDAIVELRDGRWAAFEIKIGGKANIEKGVNNLELLTHRLKKDKLRKMMSRNIITAGELSYHEPDAGVNIISLGHLYI
jgi:predicted AAA+ superfamily ATPase